MREINSDLAVEAFLTLRKFFFDEQGNPKPFGLRPKRNTQDDPFDELLTTQVFSGLPEIKCEKAPGPLITPDLVLFRPDQCGDEDKRNLRDDINCILAIEVKKLERTQQGGVARSSGLDYNTTPPCGLVRVYDAAGVIIDIRSFYLFVCLEIGTSNNSQVFLSALTLVDGDILNTDFGYYLSIVGERKKRIGLGSYADGADRARPMLIFSNPLGAKELDHHITLIHPSAYIVNSNLRLVYEIERATIDNKINTFYCYRMPSDISSPWDILTLKDPLPVPTRDSKTRPRGRFKLPFKIRNQ